MKIKINPLDKIFSKYVRRRDKVCQRCGNGNTILQCAHFHGRSEKATRWDEDNACALCTGCHMYLDGHPLEKIDFFKARLGDKYDLLNARRRNRQKPDTEGLYVYYNQKLKELGDGYD